MYAEPSPSRGGPPLAFVDDGAGRRLQRSRGAASVRFKVNERGRTVLADLAQSAPCRAMVPRSDDLPTAAFISTCGGLTSGDHVTFDLALDAGAEAVATTQAAEKLDRAAPGGEPAVLESTVHVGDGAYCEWLPQETILFDGSRLRRKTVFDLAEGAALLACELRVLGRAAHGEVYGDGFLLDRIEVRRGGGLDWLDILRLGSDPLSFNEHRSPEAPQGAVRGLPEGGAHLGGRPRPCASGLSGDRSVIGRAMGAVAGFHSRPAVGTILYAAPNAESCLGQARAILDAGLPAKCAATAWDGKLIVRMLANDVQSLRAATAHFIRAFRAHLGRAPVMPRFWSL